LEELNKFKKYLIENWNKFKRKEDVLDKVRGKVEEYYIKALEEGIKYAKSLKDAVNKVDELIRDIERKIPETLYKKDQELVEVFTPAYEVLDRMIETRKRQLGDIRKDLISQVRSATGYIIARQREEAEKAINSIKGMISELEERVSAYRDIASVFDKQGNIAGSSAAIRKYHSLQEQIKYLRENVSRLENLLRQI